LRPDSDVVVSIPATFAYLAAVDKDQVIEILSEIGTLLELKGENPFKTRAYANAARTLKRSPNPWSGSLPRNGWANSRASARRCGEDHAPRHHRTPPYYEDLKASLPGGLVEMLVIPGLGPKKIKALHDRLGVDSVARLEAACQAGEVAQLDGFGEKTQTKDP
jgi:DNA polymerase (family 10)